MNIDACRVLLLLNNHHENLKTHVVFSFLPQKVPSYYWVPIIGYLLLGTNYSAPMQSLSIRTISIYMFTFVISEHTLYIKRVFFFQCFCSMMHIYFTAFLASYNELCSAGNLGKYYQVFIISFF